VPKFLEQKEAFLNCKREGSFLDIAGADAAKIKTILNIAEGDIAVANEFKERLKKDSFGWNTIYKLYYDALHELVEAFLRFDKIKSTSHQCLFVYLCEKHPELEFDWKFFEKVRTKRNGIHYYGTPVNHANWKEVEIQFVLYINKLREEIKKKLTLHEC
jgi:hypothetical protein